MGVLKIHLSMVHHQFWICIRISKVPSNLNRQPWQPWAICYGTPAMPGLPWQRPATPTSMAEFMLSIYYYNIIFIHILLASLLLRYSTNSTSLIYAVKSIFISPIQRKPTFRFPWWHADISGGDEYLIVPYFSIMIRDIFHQAAWGQNFLQQSIMSRKVVDGQS